MAITAACSRLTSKEQFGLVLDLMHSLVSQPAMAC
jgi:hypothetical protein